MANNSRTGSYIDAAKIRAITLHDADGQVCRLEVSKMDECLIVFGDDLADTDMAHFIVKAKVGLLEAAESFA